MIHPSIRREIAERYHRALPEGIRAYLKGRGIPATLIEEKLLGWNGERITIPIFGAKRSEVLSFRYAKSPQDTSAGPKMRSELGADPTLYGLETLAKKPGRVVICEGEFDRLVLEANGFPAVTSTAGAQTFLPDWVPFFKDIQEIYICFDCDPTGEAGARKVQTLVPHARIVTLPADVGEKGDVTDFFMRLGKEPVDFEVLLSEASARDVDPTRPAERPPVMREFRPAEKALWKRAKRLKAAVHLHEVVERYAKLHARGSLLVAHCPFHDDRNPSFTVYPQSDTYYCFGCETHGDVVKFLMDMESMSYKEALATLERFRLTHELFPSAA